MREPELTEFLLSKIAPIELKAKFLFALAKTVHMNADQDFVVGLPVLLNDATLDEACVNLNALVASEIDHDRDVGSALVDGAHQTTDTAGVATLQVLPILNPTTATLDDLVNVITELDTARYNHASQIIGGVHVHFHDDLDENNFNLTYSGAAMDTLAKAIQSINELRQAFTEHFARAAF